MWKGERVGNGVKFLLNQTRKVVGSELEKWADEPLLKGFILLQVRFYDRNPKDPGTFPQAKAGLLTVRFDLRTNNGFPLLSNSPKFISPLDPVIKISIPKPLSVPFTVTSVLAVDWIKNKLDLQVDGTKKNQGNIEYELVGSDVSKKFRINDNGVIEIYNLDGLSPGSEHELTINAYLNERAYRY